MNNTDSKNNQVVHTGRKKPNAKKEMTPIIRKTIAKADQKTDGTKKVT
jgi:hypothetical protein